MRPNEKMSHLLVLLKITITLFFISLRVLFICDGSLVGPLFLLMTHNWTRLVQKVDEKTLGKYLFIVLFLVFSKGHKFDFNINQKNIFPCIITRVYVFFLFLDQWWFGTHPSRHKTKASILYRNALWAQC